MTNVSMPKNLLQGRGAKALGSSLDKASAGAVAKSLELAPASFLNVKQLKPVKMEYSSAMEHQTRRETEPALAEAMILRNSGGIKVANPSVYVM